MAIDIYNSRRDYPYRCLFYKRKSKRSAEQEGIRRSDKPDGVFFAREIQGIERNSDEDSDVFDVPYQYETLETQDDLSQAQKGDLVVAGGSKWIILSITRKKLNRRSYFSIRPSSVYILELRSGVDDAR